MERGDAGAARRIMEAHVLTAGEALGDWLSALAAEAADHEVLRDQP
jgi:hypothetical protein